MGNTRTAFYSPWSTPNTAFYSSWPTPTLPPPYQPPSPLFMSKIDSMLHQLSILREELAILQASQNQTHSNTASQPTITFQRDNYTAPLPSITNEAYPHSTQELISLPYMDNKDTSLPPTSLDAPIIHPGDEKSSPVHDYKGSSENSSSMCSSSSGLVPIASTHDISSGSRESLAIAQLTSPGQKTNVASSSVQQIRSLPSSQSGLTAQERRIRREKGLCFCCTAKFTPGHRCSSLSAHSNQSGFGFRPFSSSSPLSLPSPTAQRKSTPQDPQFRLATGLCFRCQDWVTHGHRCYNPSLALMVVSEKDDGFHAPSPPNHSEKMKKVESAMSGLNVWNKSAGWLKIHGFHSHVHEEEALPAFSIICLI